MAWPACGKSMGSQVVRVHVAGRAHLRGPSGAAAVVRTDAIPLYVVRICTTLARSNLNFKNTGASVP